jgi:hypothetical protein
MDKKEMEKGEKKKNKVNIFRSPPPRPPPSVFGVYRRRIKLIYKKEFYESRELFFHFMKN